MAPSLRQAIRPEVVGPLKDAEDLTEDDIRKHLAFIKEKFNYLTEEQWDFINTIQKNLDGSLMIEAFPAKKRLPWPW